MNKKSLMIATLSMGLAFAGSNAFAQDCKDCPPPPPKKTLCHNIGGPMELGANCDGATGECTFTYLDDLMAPHTMTVPQNHFLGIIIGASSEGAIAAHLAHGDGFVIATFEPRLHLASSGQIHKGSSVDCMAERAITTQPPEPGN